MSERSTSGSKEAPPFDSTQTLRALTPRELQDPHQQKCFVVQLAVLDRPVNLETMPQFEVFATYRLYAIQGRLGANACYALRLGFFSDKDSAQTICEGMKAFYRAASVVQVSAAEQVRFERVPKSKVPSPAVADVIDISSARRSVPAAPIVPQPATVTKKPLAAGSAKPARPAASAQVRKKFKSLSQELLEEARQIELERSAKHNPKRRTGSWLSRLLGPSNN